MTRAVAFDFDGVIVESVAVKTHAFARLFEDEGAAVVSQVVAHHLAHGGVSRVEKIRYAYQEILRRPLSAERLQLLSERFRQFVFEGVVRAPWVPGALEAIRVLHASGLSLYVVSGTPEDELREVVARRALASYFTGVYGSPTTKDVLLSRVLGGRLQPNERLFVGDAMTDFAGAQATRVRFVARATSDGPDWSALGVPAMNDLAGLPEFVAGLDVGGRG